MIHNDRTTDDLDGQVDSGLDGQVDDGLDGRVDDDLDGQVDDDLDGQVDDGLDGLEKAGLGRWAHPAPDPSGGRPSPRFELVTGVTVTETPVDDGTEAGFGSGDTGDTAPDEESGSLAGEPVTSVTVTETQADAPANGGFVNTIPGGSEDEPEVVDAEPAGLGRFDIVPGTVLDGDGRIRGEL